MDEFLTYKMNLTSILISIGLLAIWWVLMARWLDRKFGAPDPLLERLIEKQSKILPIGEAFFDRELTELKEMLREMTIRIQYVEREMASLKQDLAEERAVRRE